MRNRAYQQLLDEEAALDGERRTSLHPPLSAAAGKTRRHKADIILVFEDSGTDSAAIARSKERTRCIQKLAKRLEVRQEIHEFNDCQCLHRSVKFVLLEAIPTSDDSRELAMDMLFARAAEQSSLRKRMSQDAVIEPGRQPRAAVRAVQVFTQDLQAFFRPPKYANETSGFQSATDEYL